MLRNDLKFVTRSTDIFIEYGSLGLIFLRSFFHSFHSIKTCNLERFIANSSSVMSVVKNYETIEFSYEKL